MPGQVLSEADKSDSIRWIYINYEK